MMVTSLTETAEDSGELHSDGAAAHDGDFDLGSSFQTDRFVAGDDLFLSIVIPGICRGCRTGCENFFLHRRASACRRRWIRPSPCRRRRPEPLIQSILFFFEQELDAAGQPLDDSCPCGPEPDSCRAHSGLADRQAPFLPVLRDLEGVRVLDSALVGMQPQLRHVPPRTGARSTRRHLEPELRGPGWPRHSRRSSQPITTSYSLAILKVSASGLRFRLLPVAFAAARFQRPRNPR